tara:strand:- start:1140 stop:1340 length:201 start_codon:yes stop_codon:yes gene_type:complete
VLAKIITTIRAEQHALAIEAIKVQTAEGKDIGFEYGKRQGVYAGLDRAVQLIERIYRDIENDQRDL